MKLTSTQLTTVETYLLSWELQFRDFYDEMFDHFCSEIEQRMSGGKTFDNALAETSYLFDGREFSGSSIFGGNLPEFYNIKAVELERFHSMRRKYQSDFFLILKSQFLSWRILVWGVVIATVIIFITPLLQPALIFIPFLSDTFLGSFVSGMLLGIGLAGFPLLHSNIPLSESILKYVFRAIRRKDIELGKKFQLRRNSRLHAFINLMLRFILPYLLIVSVCMTFDLPISPLFLSTLGLTLLIIIYCFTHLFIKNKAKLTKKSF